jgi:anti-anti-sigma factor
MRPDAPRYRPFAISVEHGRDEVVLTLTGELDIESAGTLEQAVAQVRAADYAEIVLDLRHVEFIDSTGLRVLLSLRNDAKRTAYRLGLVPPAPPVRRIFQITGTRGLFDWRSDRRARAA